MNACGAEYSGMADDIYGKVGEAATGGSYDVWASGYSVVYECVICESVVAGYVSDDSRYAPGSNAVDGNAT